MANLSQSKGIIREISITSNESQSVDGKFKKKDCISNQTNGIY